MTEGKPNIPFRGDYPKILELIQQASPLLASELLKLPEIQDGISAEEAVALEKVVESYNNCTADFERAFDEMYKVGLPNVRSYCTPLQALFWLAKDGKSDELCSLLHYYTLRLLLYNAWTSDYSRWSDYNTVVDRLNAPELIDLYINQKIKYRTYVRAQGAYATFRFKEGHCIDAAYLAMVMLKRNGYTTFMRHVKWGPNDWIDNHCVSGIILEDGSYIIVADFTRTGNVLSGPYRSVDDLDNTISRGKSIYDRTWGTFWPP